MSGNKGWSCFKFRMAIRDDSESVQITKCSLDDLLMSLKANKMALNEAYRLMYDKLTHDDKS